MSVFKNIFTFFENFIQNIYLLFTSKFGHSVTDMHYINIRFGSTDYNLPLKLDNELTVAQIKDKLIKNIGNNIGIDDPNEIVIIFAGKEIDNQVKLIDFDLGRNSVLHAVKIKRKTQSKSSASQLISDTLATLSLLNNTENEFNAIFDKSSSNKSHFFVYCSHSKCKRINHGKLRVICSNCKNATLIAKRDPSNWDDVLIDGRIDGVCQSDRCDGSTALFYFKCASQEHNDTYENNSSVVLYLVRYNFIQVQCLACTEIKDVIIVFSCKSGHVICIDCFKDYCISRLNERGFIIDQEIGYTLGCPVGCDRSLIKETHHFHIMSDYHYEKYQQFAAEECLLQAGGVLCPQPNCGAGILIDSTDVQMDCNRITCVSCGYVFCRSCHQGYHVGKCLDNINSAASQSTQSKGIDLENADQSKWIEQLSLSAIQMTTKPCPKCRTPTERDGGCMHMICMRSQCGFNWCWICQTEWNRECMGNHWFG